VHEVSMHLTGGGHRCGRDMPTVLVVTQRRGPVGS
jgi:hypothetical protein